MAGLFLLTGGCYDDSKIRKQLEDHEKRILALEQLCTQMNTNIASLQKIVEALQNNDFVTDASLRRMLPTRCLCPHSFFKKVFR